MNRIIKIISSVIISFGIIILMNVNSEALYQVPKTINVNHTVNGSHSIIYSTELYLYPNEIVRINLSYTPANADVDIGLQTPSGSFVKTGGDNGSFLHTFTINSEGIYKLKIKNNSSNNVTVNGECKTGWKYMFKSNYMAKNISNGYSASTGHKGIDITANPANVYGYPIYSTGNGVVKYCNHYYDCGYMVAILLNSGYEIRYLHLKNDILVSNNQSVDNSTHLGYVSGTGSNGYIQYPYHLHFDINTIETYDGGQMNFSNTINPELVFPQINFTHLG